MVSAQASESAIISTIETTAGSDAVIHYLDSENEAEVEFEEDGEI